MLARSLAPMTLIALLGPAPPVRAESGCGGDAFSSAQVVEGRAPRRGPLTAVPDTLCADLEARAPDGVLIDAYPVVTPQVGTRRGGDPYEDRRPRAHRP